LSDASDSARVPWAEVLTRAQAPSLVLVCLGVWLHAADALIVATMLPAVVRDLGGAAYVSWSVALYELGSIVAGTVSALWVLRWGVHRAMVGAALVFALGCIVSAVAPGMPVLLVGRLLQGLGGGGLSALAFIGVARLFSPRLMARVMALISILWGASAFLGPLIGGLFVTYATWRTGFLFFAAQACALACLILFGIGFPGNAQAGPAPRRAPLGRLALLAAGTLLVASAGVSVSWRRTPALLGLGFAAISAFLWLDRRHAETRLLPRHAFGLGTPAGAALLMNLLLSMATIGLATYGPILMTVIHHIPAITAGYVLAAEAIGWSLTAVALSGAPETQDTRHILGGMVVVTLGVGGMIWAIPHGPVGLIAAFATLQGAGFGSAWTFVLRRARRLVAPDDLERLSGAMSSVGHFGYGLGAALTGIVANAAGFSERAGADEARHVALAVYGFCLPMAILGLGATVRFVRPAQPSTLAR